MTEALTQRLRALIDHTEGLAPVLDAILDRRERRGRMPKTVTVAADAPVERSLAEAFSQRAVARVDEGRVRIDLGRVVRAMGEEGALRLERCLYDASGRRPRDPVAEERERRRALDSGLEALGALARGPAARSWLAEQRRVATSDEDGELLALARAEDVERAAREAEVVVRAVDGALDNRELVRVQAFAARVLGSSKGLPWRGPRFRRVCAALYDHDEATRHAVWEMGDHGSVVGAQALALEAHGIYRDVAAASALCFGPLVYEAHGERFDHVARHAAHGECSRLVVSQLAHARLCRPGFEQVTLVENLTPFLDYVESTASPGGAGRELVLCSGGQASWATVRLLRMVAPWTVPVRHSGDLDRSGVLILRSLARRAGISIEPWHMDAATHRRYASHGIAVGHAERRRLATLLERDDPDRPCHGLLREVHRTGLWIEQEVFSDACLVGEEG